MVQKLPLQLLPTINGVEFQVSLPIEGITFDGLHELCHHQIIIRDIIVACLYKVGNMLSHITFFNELLELLWLVIYRLSHVVNYLRIWIAISVGRIKVLSTWSFMVSLMSFLTWLGMSISIALGCISYATTFCNFFYNLFVAMLVSSQKLWLSSWSKVVGLLPVMLEFFHYKGNFLVILSYCGYHHFHAFDMGETFSSKVIDPNCVKSGFLLRKGDLQIASWVAFVLLMHQLAICVRARR